MSKMTVHDYLQIEMAAAGCVSGTLSEWPHLNNALKRVGIELPSNTEAWGLRNLCQQLLEQHEAP